ncbi:hypothetical protein BGZ94_002473 [Podila epigama]|nr:hypothetical protein BGZ94_002473 [Podila epigama]
MLSNAPATNNNTIRLGAAILLGSAIAYMIWTATSSSSTTKPGDKPAEKSKTTTVVTKKKVETVSTTTTSSSTTTDSEKSTKTKSPEAPTEHTKQDETIAVVDRSLPPVSHDEKGDHMNTATKSNSTDIIAETTKIVTEIATPAAVAVAALEESVNLVDEKVDQVDNETQEQPEVATEEEDAEENEEQEEKVVSVTESSNDEVTTKDEDEEEVIEIVEKKLAAVEPLVDKQEPMVAHGSLNIVQEALETIESAIFTQHEKTFAVPEVLAPRVEEIVAAPLEATIVEQEVDVDTPTTLVDEALFMAKSNSTNSLDEPRWNQKRAVDDVQTLAEISLVAQHSELNAEAPEFTPTWWSAPRYTPAPIARPRNTTTTRSEEPAKLKSRCRFWPKCTNKSCKFVHPTITCRDPANCSFGERCIFIHPSDVARMQDSSEGSKKNHRRNATRKRRPQSSDSSASMASVSPVESPMK